MWEQFINYVWYNKLLFPLCEMNIQILNTNEFNPLEQNPLWSNTFRVYIWIFISHGGNNWLVLFKMSCTVYSPPITIGELYQWVVKLGLFIYTLKSLGDY